MVKCQILDDQNSSIKELTCIDKYSDFYLKKNSEILEVVYIVTFTCSNFLRQKIKNLNITRINFFIFFASAV